MAAAVASLPPTTGSRLSKSGPASFPLEFVCPLSLEVMRDPVIVATGQTYERVYIERWLADGHKTCPKTRQELPHSHLCPNQALRTLINDWCTSHNVTLKPLQVPAKPIQVAKESGIPRAPSADKLDSLNKQEPEQQLEQHAQTSPKRESPQSVLERRRSFSQDPGMPPKPMPAARSFGPHLTSDSSRSLERTMSPKPIRPTLEGTASPAGSASPLSSRSADPWASEAKEEGDSNRQGGGDDSMAAFLNQNSSPASGGGRGRRNRKAAEVDDTPYSKRLLNTAVTRRGRRMSSDSNVLEMRPLVEDLVEGTMLEQRRAAFSIRTALKDAPENRMRLVGAGGIKPLVLATKSHDVQTVEHSVTALLLLSLAWDAASEVISSGGVHGLVGVLKRDDVSENARCSSAAALFALSGPEENKKLVWSAGAVPPLVDLLSCDSGRAKKDACLALYNLAQLPKAAHDIVAEGAVVRAVELLSEPEEGVEEKVAALLGVLARHPDGREAIDDEEDGVYCLVDVIEGGSDKAKEYAATALLHMAKHVPGCMQALLFEGCLPPLVRLANAGKAQSDSKKLLELLREYTNKKSGSSRSNSGILRPF